MKRIFLLLLIVLVWNGCNAFSLKETGSISINISEESSRLLEPNHYLLFLIPILNQFPIWFLENGRFRSLL